MMLDEWPAERTNGPTSGWTNGQPLTKLGVQKPESVNHVPFLSLKLIKSW